MYQLKADNMPLLLMDNLYIDKRLKKRIDNTAVRPLTLQETIAASLVSVAKTIARLVVDDPKELLDLEKNNNNNEVQ